MRATLNIPDDLLSEVQKATGEKSKTKAITFASAELLRAEKDQKASCDKREDQNRL